MSKLSNKVKEVLENAFSSHVEEAKELIDAIDKATADDISEAGAKYVTAGLLVATANDNTDAATLEVKVGDVVALIKDADQTLQTITTDDEFVTAPAIGDLIHVHRPIV